MTQLAYILAASHSGSTLLTMLLNTHPDVATIGELSPGHMEDTSWYLCSCGTRIRECPFWQHVVSSVRNKGVAFDLEDFGTAFRMPDSRVAARLLRPLYRGPAFELLRDAGLHLFSRWPRRVRQIARVNEILVNVVMRYYHARVFVDKGNRALRLKYLLRIPSFEVRVIRLIRDGRAVALAYTDPATFADANDSAMRGGGSGGQREDERLSMAQAAYQWRRSNEEAEGILHGIDESRRIEIRYEDLCKDTQNTLARLFGFLGLDPGKQAEDFRSVEHHIVGNGMRLDTTSGVLLDERWKMELTKGDLRMFENEAGEMNRRYGYELA